MCWPGKRLQSNRVLRLEIIEVCLHEVFLCLPSALGFRLLGHEDSTTVIPVMLNP